MEADIKYMFYYAICIFYFKNYQITEAFYNAKNI